MGECGNTAEHCSCKHCTNYTRLYRDWEESGGTQKWRHDGKCGYDYPLPDGTPGQCDPDGDKPCCSNSGQYARCSNIDFKCICTDCIDYRVVREIQKSGKNCTLTKIQSGFLKKVCFDDVRNRIHYKCIHSDVSYKANYADEFDNSFLSVTEFCDNDPHFYQACGLNTEITNTDVLCGGYISDQKIRGKNEYIKCREENCETQKSHIPEYKYGVTCKNYYSDDEELPAFCVCDGYEDCDDGEDEQDCTVTNSTVYTCTNYGGKVIWGRTLTVPIYNYTRCSEIDVRNEKYPYCLNYLDQTNCSDIERVGGYCKVNGYNSTVSKYMLCYEYDQMSELSVTLCDDDFQNNCISPSNSDNRVHKHLMCNGVEDCPDGSDESHQMCRLTTEEINYSCKRRFSPKIGKTRLPITWIMDNVTDCMNGEDKIQNCG